MELYAMTVGSYAPEKKQLLKDFDRMVKHVKVVLESRYGEGFASMVIPEIRQEYEVLIPQVPYIGDKRPFTQWLLATAQFLAMYRVFKRHSKSVEEDGRIGYEVSDRMLNAYPRFLLRFFGRTMFSKKRLGNARMYAEESQKRKYLGAYVFRFVVGDNENFDFGIDYTECASQKFLAAQHALELAPYICATDILQSERFGWGLTRTMILAEGAEKCDFRFKKGGRTNIKSTVLAKD
jgi:hypothetical protein